MPALRLYNSLSRQIEEIAPIDGKTVRLYTCGPTVYNFAHIGNLRTYVSVDLLMRTLRFLGQDVKHVMNFTDVDDKTIRGSREAGVPLKEFTQQYAVRFNEDLDALHIKRPDKQPFATDHIADMIALVETLLAKDLAYATADGTVYFRIDAFPNYGCLAHLDREGLQAGARVSQDEYEKEGVGDFALWKAWAEADGDVGWDSPWGRGRPGWHLECSAMSKAYLGDTFDLHAGGEDLCFPHHENEIAQSEGASGKPFVRHWMHAAHLHVDGRKMSKSLGNLYTVADIVAKGYEPRHLRYGLLAGHYRKNLNFMWKSLDDAKVALQRIDEWRRRFPADATAEAGNSEPSRRFLDAFTAALCEDLNLPAALGAVFDYIKETNRLLDTGEAVPDLAVTWAHAETVLGFGDEAITIPAEVQTCLDQRAAARAAKDFAKSDELRDAIIAFGWQVKDTKDGQEITKL